ncbi:DNA polymerase III subunit beta [Micromonospora sp. C51]|uniref:DNA polymerase III subunit beta n=1 Tax=Micromonospora sp. C51 TaxID=2824879 RepID=UPI001B3797DB|nr:DNA polymerase III subunit beta [Micromonospora sp. C51]MBQ1047826.1 DNA polymerase III subunit beta [Micromonospora sp. C51]
MRFTIDPKRFAEAVAWTAKSIPTRPALPVLAGLMLRVSDARLTLSTFDYEVSHEVTLDVAGASDGACLVSGRLVNEIAKALPAKRVEVSSAGQHLELLCGAGRFTLPAMPAEDYPTLPTTPFPVGAVDASAFAAAVARVAVAAGRDDALPLLTGIRLEIAGDRLTMLATDRYRLGLVEISWATTNPDARIDALVPAKTLHDTAKTLGPLGGAVALSFTGGRPGEGLLGLTAGPRRTTTRLLDPTNYPPMRNLLPATALHQACFHVATLVDAVKRVALVAERTAPIVLTLTTDGLRIDAGGTEQAHASETMDATYAGTDLSIGFNPQYLLDGLSQVGSPHAVLSVIDPHKPAVIDPADVDGHAIPGYRYMLMPIRISR